MNIHMPPNPMTAVARDALEMGDKHGNKAFQTMAMVSMGVVAFAGASQVIMELLKAINRQDQGRGGYSSRENGPRWQDREHDREPSRGRERGA